MKSGNIYTYMRASPQSVKGSKALGEEVTVEAYEARRLLESAGGGGDKHAETTTAVE